VGFAWDGPAPAVEPPGALQELCVLCGPIADGVRLDYVSDDAIARWAAGDRATHRLRFASGAGVEGRVARVVRRADGRLAYVDWQDARITLPGKPPRSLAHYRLLAAGDVVTARAGAVDPTYHPETAFSSARVPQRHRGDPQSLRLLALYESAERAHHAGPSAVATTFPAIHATLERDYPREWLLRWNLLESLIKLRAEGDLARSLRAELEDLEVRYDRRQPIASGLRYLARIAA
jgi:hypothetical protein